MIKPGDNWVVPKDQSLFLKIVVHKHSLKLIKARNLVLELILVLFSFCVIDWVHEDRANTSLKN